MIKLINADCLPAMKEMPDKAFDVCLTDPPYGVGIDYKSYNDTEENWYDLMSSFIPEAKRISKMLIMPSCQIKRLGWFYKHYPPDWLICWHKGSTGCASFIGFNDWEPLLVYGKLKSKSYIHDYISINNTETMGKYGHPCPKPVRWAKTILKSIFGESNGSVIDPFCGSGTCALACHDLGLDFTGYEIDKDYFQAGKERLERHMAQSNLFMQPTELIVEAM